MRPDEYVVYDGLGLARLVRDGDVSPDEMLSAAIAAVESSNNQVNAVVTPMNDPARAAIAAGLPAGAFHGVPYLLKDLGAMYAGVVTSNGSRLFKDNVATHDTTLVTRYKDSGLVIFGKTNTPEFGLATTTEPVLFGPTRNPWKTTHSTGGSSGGAAAAVAAGYVPMAQASDGGGSIRVPASCCGLFGLKPTRARVPLGPDAMEGWGGLSTIHAVTRTVRDSAALLDLSAGEEPGSPYFAPPRERPYLEEVEREPGSLRVAVCLETFTGAPVDDEVRAITEQAAEKLASLGHNLEAARPEIDSQLMKDAHGILAVSNVGAMIDKFEARTGRRALRKELETTSWNNFQASHQITGSMYAQAVGNVHQLGLQVARFFQRYDLLLTPTMACLPPELGALDMMSEDVDGYLSLLFRMIGFTSLFNDTGNPAMSTPLGMSASRLPVGVQFVAAFGNEPLLFRIAAQLESAGLFTPLRNGIIMNMQPTAD